MFSASDTSFIEVIFLVINKKGLIQRFITLYTSNQCHCKKKERIEKREKSLRILHIILLLISCHDVTTSRITDLQCDKM